MASQVYHGKRAVVKYKTKTLYQMNNWSLTADFDMPDVTVFSTAGVTWRSVTPGLGSWSGSVSGFADLAGDSSGQKVLWTNLATPATGTVKLYTDDSGTMHFYGNVYIKSLNVSAAVDAVEPIVFNYQGSGALTWSTTG